MFRARVINFYWHSALCYPVPCSNYICINYVHHYYYGVGRAGTKGVKGGALQYEGARTLFLSWPTKVSKTCAASAQRESRFPSKWGHREASLGNIKCPCVDSQWREWWSSSPQTLQCVEANCDLLSAIDEKIIHLVLIMSRRPNVKMA